MTKKLFSILIISLVIKASLYSQNLRFSFLASPQFVWLQGDNSGFETQKGLLGLNTGIEMDLFFTENYAFSTGLTITSLGGGVSYEDSIYLGQENKEILLEPGNTIDYKLQYLNIPLGLKFKTVEIGYKTFWLNTGVNTMFSLKSLGNDESGIFTKTDIKDDIGGINFNYFIEAGVEYSIGGNTAIIGGLGYNSGLMDVTNRATDKITTKAFSIILGVLF